MYEVTTDRQDYIISIKYLSKPYKHKRQQRRRLTFFFAFSPKDIEQLQKHMDPKKEMLVCLVCDDNHICVLNQQEISELKLTKATRYCTVLVFSEKNTELTVKFRGSELSHKVPRNRLKTLFK